MAAALDRLRAHTFEERHASLPKLSVCKGAFVKVGVRGERFRCCVKSIRGDGALLGVVDNDLLKSPWRRGEEIVLQRNHVLDEFHRRIFTFRWFWGRN